MFMIKEFWFLLRANKKGRKALSIDSFAPGYFLLRVLIPVFFLFKQKKEAKKNLRVATSSRLLLDIDHIPPTQRANNFAAQSSLFN